MVSASTLGRPRDAEIDEAVLRATVDLLEQHGYLGLTIEQVAREAGTTKPAIYRRWSTKARLVHAAVFPAQDFAPVRPGRTLRADIEALVRVGLDLLGRPAARAALPGLLAESVADTFVAADVLGQAAGGTFEWLDQRLAAGVAAGEVRRGVNALTVFELVAGAAFIATTTRPASIDKRWVRDTADVVVRGIAP